MKRKKASAMDTKYLQQRGSTWHFTMAIPKALQGRFKSPTGRALTRIAKALGPNDLPEPQRFGAGLASAPPDVSVRPGATLDPVTLQPATAAPALRAPRGGGWTVSRAGAELIAEKQRTKLSHDRLVAIRTAFRLFCDHIGADTPLA